MAWNLSNASDLSNPTVPVQLYHLRPRQARCFPSWILCLGPRARYSLLSSRSNCPSRSHSLSTPLLLTAWLRAASLPLISAATAASPRPSTASPESLLTQDLGTFGGWSCHCFVSGCPFWRLCEVTPQVSWHTFPPPTFCHMPIPGLALSIYPTCPPLFARSFCQSWLLCWSVMSPQALPVTSLFPRGVVHNCFEESLEFGELDAIYGLLACRANSVSFRPVGSWPLLQQLHIPCESQIGIV